MSEINTNAQANRLPGLASGMNTTQTVENLLQVERRRMQPVEGRKKETQTELDSYQHVKESLEKWNETVKSLAANSIWEGKLVESSNQEVVTATATAGARPGKHTLVVDRLALNHQISSQGYPTTDSAVGKGRFTITVGQDPPVNVVIDDSNNTLEGLRDAINGSDAKVNATIIRTGNQEKPHQLVLTSKKTGSEGRIQLDIHLQGGETPNFSNFVDPPSAWKGVGEAAQRERVPTGTGASTAIARVIGEYAGKEDKTYTFTAVQTGTVGGQNPLQLRWKASTGQSGTLELDSFNYAPGEPIEFADGLSLIMSEGDILVGDSFTVRGRAEKSGLYWWLDESERVAAYTQPSRWNRQQTYGVPVIEGPYQGDHDRSFKLTVEGSGQVGTASNLAIKWESDDGESGVVRVGRGYQPGTKLALLDGVTVSLNPGVLSEGDVSTFSVTAEELSGRWWLDEKERRIPSEIRNVTPWTSTKTKEEEEAFAPQPEFPEEFGPRVSSTEVKVSGVFQSDEPKVYTFTALRDGTIGTTKDLRIRWTDDKGNSGELKVGDTYPVGAAIPFDAGLAVTFGAGRVFNEDTFTVRTHTSTIQPPQDALIRLGATEFGGGLEITSPTNELDAVIEGIKLRLVATSDKPVTITVKGDTQKALETVKAFAEQYNQFATLVNELTKFDRDNNVIGPLLGDRDIDNFRNTISALLINPVPGLPKEANMLFTLGLKLNDKGLLDVQEDALRNKIDGDFGAVADLFRSKGESGNSGVVVVGLTDDTKVSAEGYPVEITQVPSQGSFSTPALPVPIVVTEANKSFYLSVDGRRSEAITVPPGVYTVGEYARALQNRITNDPQVGSRHVRVVNDGNRVRFFSGTFGSRSSIALEPVNEAQPAPPGLMEGTPTDGRDVAGTINNEPAEGLGQVLRGSDTSPDVKGLRLFVTLSENQLAPHAPEAVVKVSKGVASRLGAYLAKVVDPLRGEMKRITDGLHGQLKSYDRQLEQMNGRIDRKRQVLQDKFSRLESQLSQLRTQQSFVASQAASLPGAGGGGGIPGLPGLPQ